MLQSVEVLRLTHVPPSCTGHGGRFLYGVAVVWVRDRQNIFFALLGAGRRPTWQPFRPPLGSRRDYGALDSLWFLQDIRIRLSVSVSYTSLPLQCGNYVHGHGWDVRKLNTKYLHIARKLDRKKYI